MFLFSQTDWYNQNLYDAFPNSIPFVHLVFTSKKNTIRLEINGYHFRSCLGEWDIASFNWQTGHLLGERNNMSHFKPFDSIIYKA